MGDQNKNKFNKYKNSFTYLIISLNMTHTAIKQVFFEKNCLLQ